MEITYSEILLFESRIYWLHIIYVHTCMSKKRYAILLYVLKYMYRYV